MIALVIFYLLNFTALYYSKFRKRKYMALICINAFIIEPLAMYIGLSLLRNRISGYSLEPVNLFLLFLIDDLWTYSIHKLFHMSPRLYKKIHSVHHIATVPTPMDIHLIHPLEILIVPSGFFLAIFCLDQISYFSLWLFIILKITHEFINHSDINFKIPMLTSAEEHGLHHTQVKGNYGSTFEIWDLLFGTKII